MKQGQVAQEPILPAEELVMVLRRLISLLGLIVLLVAIAACAEARSGPTIESAPKVEAYSGGPRLSLDSKLIDFGAVPFNKEVKANFQVKNVGDQRLVISKVDVKTVEGC